MKKQQNTIDQILRGTLQVDHIASIGKSSEEIIELQKELVSSTKQELLQAVLGVMPKRKIIPSNKELEDIYKQAEGNVSRGEIYEAEVHNVLAHNVAITEVEENIQKLFKP